MGAPTNDFCQSEWTVSLVYKQQQLEEEGGYQVRASVHWPSSWGCLQGHWPPGGRQKVAWPSHDRAAVAGGFLGLGTLAWTEGTLRPQAGLQSSH